MFKYIFLFAIVIAPFTTIFDSLFWTILGERTDIITPLWLRALDEIICVFIFVILIDRVVKDYQKLYKVNKLYNSMMLLIIISISYSILFNPILITLSGLKWVMFLFMVGTFFYLDTHEKEYIYAKLIWVLIGFSFLNLLLQLIQLIAFANYFHPTFFGLSQRTIGFFKEPNTLALFNIISFYFIYTYMKERLLKRVMIFCILPISIILSGSITSLLTLVLIIVVINVKVNMKSFIVLFLILLGIFYFLAPYIPSRPGLINSILIRLDIILNNITIDNFLFSKFFGYGTSTAILLNISDKIPESSIGSFLINIGVLGMIFLYLILFNLFQLEKAKLFLVCYLAMSLTNCIFSAYPINLLVSFELASLLIMNEERGINVNN